MKQFVGQPMFTGFATSSTKRIIKNIVVRRNNPVQSQQLNYHNNLIHKFYGYVVVTMLIKIRYNLLISMINTHNHTHRVYTYKHKYIHTHTCIHPYTYTHIHTYINVFIHVCIFINRYQRMS